MRPILDTIGHNPYPDTSAERPWTQHTTTSLGEGDYGKLMSVLGDAFAGTGQPLPGQGRVSIWYMEQGFESAVPASKLPFYRGRETDRFALADSAVGAPDESTQLRDAVQLASCQPGVGAIFNFELTDEPALSGWQSGLLWADGTRKPAYEAFKAAIRSVSAGAVDCARFPAGSRTASASSDIRFTAPRKP
jgi:hypothetical protein